MTTPRFPRSALALTVLFVPVAALWWALLVPALVKYPMDFDVTPHYQGRFTLYVDPATTALLATPLEVPLDIERHHDQGRAVRSLQLAAETRG